MSNSIFNVQVNDEGKSLIKEIHTISRLSFYLGLISELLVVAYATIYFLNNLKYTRESSPEYYFEVRLYLFYILTFAIIRIVQLWIFLKFSKGARRSAELNESSSFNASLRHLVLSLKVNIGGFVLNGIVFIYYIISGGQ